MKKPKLVFQEVYIVEDWATEIKKGIGIYFPELKEYLVSYSNTWLIWLNGESTPERFYSSKVFTDYGKAFNKLEEEKKKYIKYLQEDIEKKTERLKELKP